MQRPEDADAPLQEQRGAEDASTGKPQANHNSLLHRWQLIGTSCTDNRLSRATIAVLWAIADRMNEAGTAWPSVRKIAADAKTDKRTVTRAIKSLVDAGYLERSSGNRIDPNCYRLGMGQFAHTVGASLPLGANSPVGANLSQGYGRTCPKGMGEPAHVTYPKNLPIEPSQIKRAKRAPVCLPDWIPAESWQAWKRHRGKKLTEEAERLGIKKLATLRNEGQDPVELIQRAIESGWASFYPRTPSAQKAAAGSITRDSRTDDEIEAANLRELERFGMLPEAQT